MKYKTPKDVFIALKNGLLKRSSAMSTCRRLKSSGREEDEMLYREGIMQYDVYNKNLKLNECSFYDKPIDDLSLKELLDLFDSEPRMFTVKHAKRYGLLMIGSEIELYPTQIDEM